MLHSIKLVNSKPHILKFIFLIIIIQVFLLFYFVFIPNDEDIENDLKILNDNAEIKDFFYTQKNNWQPVQNILINESPKTSSQINYIKFDSMKRTLNNFKKYAITLQKILEPMKNRWQFNWIANRIIKVWSELDSSIKFTNCYRNISKNILILPGLLTLTDFARPERIRNGGPLGELLQWADLILGCHLLCHEVLLQIHFHSVIADLRVDMYSDEEKNLGCNGLYDLILTDIGGYRSLPQDILLAYKNKFLIIDAYGTEAAYNDAEYASKNSMLINRWGGLNLKLKQFLTMFPHSPDNSFLGFIVEPSSKYNGKLKQNDALIIGKEARYLNEIKSAIEVIGKYLNVTATFNKVAYKTIPFNIQLIGILTSQQYQDLLFKTKVCIGMGDPIESPSPLYAVAAGCVFLNPLTSNNYLAGKPTSRKILTQHDYLMRNVGAPLVFSYNKSDPINVENTVKKAINQTKQKAILTKISLNNDQRRLIYLVELTIVQYI